jgi:hypothetical protein
MTYPVSVTGDRQFSGGDKVPTSIVTVWPAVEKRDNPPSVLVLMIAGAAIVAGVWIVISKRKVWR